MSVNVSVIVLVSCMVNLLLLVLAKQDAYLHPLLVGGWLTAVVCCVHCNGARGCWMGA